MTFDPLSLNWGDQRTSKPLNTFDGGTNYIRLTSSQGSTVLYAPNGNTAWAFGYLINTGAAQTVTVSLYDIAPQDSLVGVNPVFGPITLGANAVVKVPIPMIEGASFAIKASAAVTADVILTYWD